VGTLAAVRTAAPRERAPTRQAQGPQDDSGRIDGTPRSNEPLADAHLEWPERVRKQSTATGWGARGSVTQKTAPPVRLPPILRQSEWPGIVRVTLRARWLTALVNRRSGQAGKSRSD
jgi:hypothetical protein